VRVGIIVFPEKGNLRRRISTNGYNSIGSKMKQYEISCFEKRYIIL